MGLRELDEDNSFEMKHLKYLVFFMIEEKLYFSLQPEGPKSFFCYKNLIKKGKNIS